MQPENRATRTFTNEQGKEVTIEVYSTGDFISTYMSLGNTKAGMTWSRTEAIILARMIKELT